MLLTIQMGPYEKSLRQILEYVGYDSRIDKILKDLLDLAPDYDSSKVIQALAVWDLYILLNSNVSKEFVFAKLKKVFDYRFPPLKRVKITVRFDNLYCAVREEQTGRLEELTAEELGTCIPPSKFDENVWLVPLKLVQKLNR